MGWGPNIKIKIISIYIHFLGHRKHFKFSEKDGYGMDDYNNKHRSTTYARINCIFKSKQMKI